MAGSHNATFERKYVLLLPFKGTNICEKMEWEVCPFSANSAGELWKCSCQSTIPCNTQSSIPCNTNLQLHHEMCVVQFCFTLRKHLGFCSLHAHSIIYTSSAKDNKSLFIHAVVCCSIYIFNIALRMVKTPVNFGFSECSRVKLS